MDLLKQESCAENIKKHLHSRLHDFQKLLEKIDIDEDADEERNAMPLSIEEMMIVKILLSWGGPSDWFEVVLKNDGSGQFADVCRVEYHFSNWFDHASVILEGTDRTVAEEFLQPFIVASKLCRNDKA